MVSARLFIRNDDVWRMDRGFRFFFDSAIEYKIPVVHAVIPGKMETGLIRFLCRAKEKTPHLLDIVQHGWVHMNHSVNTESKYEFGPSRDFEAQESDIRRGQKKMRQAFGDYFTNAFVPPYHGYDQRTLRSLHDLEFKIFSIGARRVDVRKRFIEIPAEISFSQYGEDKVRIQKARDVLTSLVKSINRCPLSGVLTHHADFSTTALRRELTVFFECIAALKAKEGWRILLFSEILSRSKRA